MMDRIINVCAISSILLLTGCSNSVERNVIDNYEVLVENAHPDMSGYKWLEHSDKFEKITFDESINFLDNGTGVLFYGAEWCDFCQRAIVELGEVAEKTNTTVYYVSLTEMDVTQEQINDLCNRLDWIIWTKNDNGYNEPNFQIPEVIAVTDGKVVGHQLSLVDGFAIDSQETQMNQEQKEELQSIYKELFRKVA